MRRVKPPFEVSLRSSRPEHETVLTDRNFNTAIFEYGLLKLKIKQRRTLYHGILNEGFKTFSITTYALYRF